ncbi:MAG: DUF2203 domain-containing protein [Candidatus Woesearchaeota archaeon]
MAEKRFFTLDEAERLLPKVERILSRLHTIKAQISVISEDTKDPVLLDDPFTEEQAFRFAFIQDMMLNKELHKHVCAFFRTFERLNDLGPVLQDLDQGLVDFPHQFNGREVNLCWQEGEERILYWHSAKPRTQKRKPIIYIE